LTALLRTEVLVIGAGLAGLSLALRLAPRPCIVLSPAALGQAAASAWAQGGIAAAVAPTDTPAAHAEDTVAAGVGLVDPLVATTIASEGPERLQELIDLGIPFDRDSSGRLSLSLEAAHSHARVVRVSGDLAGRAIMNSLVSAIRAAPHVTVLEGMRAVALRCDAGRVRGALVRSPAGEGVIEAAETVLASGGAGGLFAVTTNPIEARASAMAQAFCAGAIIADPEFVQFHPTALASGGDPAPLVTEALRGEGAMLVDAHGVPFMSRYHSRGDLAPRDIVARAIHTERTKNDGAWLDCRDSIGRRFPEAFPTVFASCLAAGIDPRSEPIPVAPAAHYHMGGVVTDLWGRTNVAGLSACGECASTGAHGANRLASNSLLESVVFATRIATRLLSASLPIPATIPSDSPDLPPRVATRTLTALRHKMSSDCGVLRNKTGLTSLLDWIASQSPLGPAPSALLAARLIVTAALHREESRGGHFREDFPMTNPLAQRSYLVRDSADGIRIELRSHSDTGALS
jgi:L-aspartate oxidase